MVKQAASLCRHLVQTGHECTKILCDGRFYYGGIRYSLGVYAESLLAYQESILLRRALAVTDSEEIHLILSLHSIAKSLLVLGRRAEANAAADGALERNHGRVLEKCKGAPCFVCQRVTIRVHGRGTASWGCSDGIGLSESCLFRPE